MTDYNQKARMCEDLAAHHVRAGDMRLANQYRLSAKHWYAKAKEQS